MRQKSSFLILAKYFWFIAMFDVLYERELVHICKYTVLSKRIVQNI